MVLVEAHVVRVLRFRVAVEATWDVRPVPYKDLCVSFDWLEEEDSVAVENSIGGGGHWLCRQLGDGEAVGSDVLEGCY
jgi:hypothetical protein